MTFLARGVWGSLPMVTMSGPACTIFSTSRRILRRSMSRFFKTLAATPVPSLTKPSRICSVPMYSWLKRCASWLASCITLRARSVNRSYIGQSLSAIVEPFRVGRSWAGIPVATHHARPNFTRDSAFSHRAVPKMDFQCILWEGKKQIKADGKPAWTSFRLALTAKGRASRPLNKLFGFFASPRWYFCGKISTALDNRTREGARNLPASPIDTYPQEYLDMKPHGFWIIAVAFLGLVPAAEAQKGGSVRIKASKDALEFTVDGELVT